MRPLEARQQGYLFKLKLTRNVKRHIERLFRERDWLDAGQGWEGRGSVESDCWEAPGALSCCAAPCKARC